MREGFPARDVQGVALGTRPVAWLAAGLGLLALGLPWLELKPNRIAPGEAFGVWGWPGLWPWILLVLWLGIALVRGRSQGWLLGLALLAWGMLVGQGATTLLNNQPESARVSPTGGFWLMLLALYVGYFAAYREHRGWAVLSAPLALTALLLLGVFDSLGLAGAVRQRTLATPRPFYQRSAAGRGGGGTAGRSGRQQSAL